MAYSRITGTRHGADAIDYARGNGKGHNDKEVRNMVVSEVNMLPETVQPYEVQMKRYWNKASVKNKNQVRRVIQSFSRKELNPDKPEDIQKANEIGNEFARRAYPGHQAVVFTQIDGKSGLIHNHIIVNNVNMETLKGSVKNFVALVKNGSFLVRITDMTILIEKEFIYGSSKRPNPTDYYRKQHYQCG